jgi:predicted nucleic acid-binding protein
MPDTDHRPPQPAAGAHPPEVVLDTNAVLDWLVFRHPSCTGWTQRFMHGQARWIASAAMRVELDHVLARPALEPWRPDADAVRAAWDRLAHVSGPPHPAGPAARVRCTDREDQKFVDLALARRARWLVSRDRALLRLARRARPLGLEVLTPEGWAGVWGG